MPRGVYARKLKTLAERLWPGVDSGGPDECWPWKRSTRNGYGAITVRYRATYAHRLSWEIVHGPVPLGLFVLHKCDNPPCCNPDHLFLGTVKDNHDDMCRKGRQPAGDRHGARLHPERFPRGEHVHGAKLTDEAVREIRRLLSTGVSQQRIAQAFGVAQSQISSVKSGLTWRHVA